MKRYLCLLLLASALVMPANMSAQDDMYFTPTKSDIAKAKKEREKIKEASNTARYNAETYYSGINKSDDEYNRRNTRKDFKPYEPDVKEPGDSLYDDVIEFTVGDGTYQASNDEVRVDTVYKYIVVDDDDYLYCRNMARFYDFYWWDRLYGPWYWNRPISWYAGWYDPWYDPWYASWWYSSWYDPYFSPWYDPFYYWSFSRWDYRGWWGYGGWWGCHHPIIGYYPSGGGGGAPSGSRYHPWAGTSNHRFNAQRNISGSKSYDIAKRNGETTTRHLGQGYRGNSNRSYRDYNTYNNTNGSRSIYNSNRSYSTSSSSSPSYSGGGHSGGSFGGHSGGMGGGGSRGGSFGGGRR